LLPFDRLRTGVGTPKNIGAGEQEPPRNDMPE